MPQPQAPEPSPGSTPAPPEPPSPEPAADPAGRCRRTAAAWARGLALAVAAVAVAAVVWAVLSGPAFKFITAAGDSPVHAAVRTAAEAAQHTLAEQPIPAEAATAAGALPPDTLDALQARAGLTWHTADGAGHGWTLQHDDTADVVRAQLIHVAVGDAQAAAVGRVPTATWASAASLPMRVHAQDSNGDWACALIVPAARPDPAETPTAPDAAGGDTPPPLGDRLKGVWYDAGRRIDADPGGMSHCSPTLPSPRPLPPNSYGNYQITGHTSGVEPLPVSDAAWKIPAQPRTADSGAIPARAWQRTTPPDR